MKKIKIISSIALLILATIGCDDNGTNKPIKNGELNIKNFYSTDCKNNAQTENFEQASVKEYLELKSDGKYLKIKHINSEFNCCPGEILVTSKISNDTIFIDENETKHECDCICRYDLDYEVGALDYGKYHVVLIKMKYPSPYVEFDLDFSSSTDEIIDIITTDY